MRKTNIVRRRGTTIAAAALSMALVAPTVQPVVYAQENAPAAEAPATPEGAQADPGANATSGAADGNAGALEDDWLSQHNENPGEQQYLPGANEEGWRHVYWAQGGKAGVTQPKVVEGTPLVYDVDAIESGQITSGIQLSNSWGAGKDVVSGRAQIVTPRQGGQLTSTYKGFKPVPDTVPVYFQWIDDDGARSPIYRTKTHTLEGPSAGQGMYAFAIPEWVDASGKKHRFKAASSQRYRVWADAAPYAYEAGQRPGDPEGVFTDTGNELIPVRTTGAGYPGAFGTGSGSALGEFPASIGTNGNMQRTGVWFYERPYAQGADPASNYMKAAPQDKSVDLTEEMNTEKPASKLIKDPFGPIDAPGTHRDKVWNRTISGTVWHESGNNNQLFNTGDKVGDARATGAQGYKVFATALTPDGASKYDTEVDSLDPWNRSEAAKKWIADNPNAIAGTVWAETDENGDYTLRFPKSVFPGEGNTYPMQGIPDQFQNHLYVWVEDGEGNVVAAPTNYSQPQFMNPNRNTQWNPTGVPAVNNAGLVGEEYRRIYNMNFATVKDPDLELDIINYNNTTHPAKRGDVARVELTGKDTLPVGAKIEWRRGAPNGDLLKSCTITSKTDLTDAQDKSKDCAELQVPADAKHGEFFFASLVNGASRTAPAISVDSFMVVVDGPVWEDSEEVPNSQDPVTLPNIGKDDPTSFPKYPEYEVFDKDGKKLPEGSYEVTIDPKTGDLTFDPKDQSTAPEESYTIKVYDKVPEIDPETGEPKVDDQGNIVFNPDPSTRRFIDDATVNYVAQNDSFEPEYAPYFYQFPNGGDRWRAAEGTSNDPAIAPVFKDENGQVVELNNVPLKKDGRNVAAFELGEEDAPRDLTNVKWVKPDGSEVDAAWKVQDSKVSGAAEPGNIHIDPATGKITFVPGTEGVDNSRGGSEAREAKKQELSGAVAKVPVTVTYADGTKDTVYAELTLGGQLTDRQDLSYGDETVTKGEKKDIKPIFKRPGTDEVVETPSGSKFTIPEDFQKPEGYEVDIDEKTGVVTVTAPENPTADTPEVVEVPVVVTYEDGSTDEATAKVLLDTDGDGVPDVDDEDDDNDGVPDDQEGVDGTNPKDDQDYNQNSLYTVTYDETNGVPGDKVTSKAPTFSAKNEKTDAPEGVKFSLPDNTPGASINEKTGEVTLEIPKDAKPGSQINIPVLVTYDDGTTERVTAPIHVGESPVVPTTIDDSGKHPVDPTNDQQGTGVIVKNPGDTSVSAKDEDGKDIPVVIDPKTGEIKVTPGEDVDGPIIVTVTDPDLPGGKQEIEIEVKDHEKGKDDNGSDKTTVDDSDVKTVDPTNDPQDSGIKVTNPDKDTKVSAKDEDGNDVPVKIDDEGKVIVTPGKKVDGPITVTITDPDLPGGKVEVEVPVNGHEKGRNDNPKATDRKGCTESLLGFGLPLLALIPLGIATQAAIPGLQAFQAQVDQQIRDMNTALQRQLGILDPNMARAAAEFDARLKGAGANLGQVLAGLALLGYGIAAIATIASACDPSNPNKRDSKLDFSSSLKPGENGSSKKQEGQEGKEGSSNEGSSKPTSETATPEEPTEGTEPTEGDEPSAPAEPTEEN